MHRFLNDRYILHQNHTIPFRRVLTFIGNNILAYLSNDRLSLHFWSILMREYWIQIWSHWPVWTRMGWSCLTLRGNWYILYSIKLNVKLDLPCETERPLQWAPQNLSTWNPLQNRTVTPSRRTYWCRYFSCESPTKRQSFSFRLILTNIQYKIYWY